MTGSCPLEESCFTFSNTNYVVNSCIEKDGVGCITEANISNDKICIDNKLEDCKNDTMRCLENIPQVCSNKIWQNQISGKCRYNCRINSKNIAYCSITTTCDYSLTCENRMARICDKEFLNCISHDSLNIFCNDTGLNTSILSNVINSCLNNGLKIDGFDTTNQRDYFCLKIDEIACGKLIF